LGLGQVRRQYTAPHMSPNRTAEPQGKTSKPALHPAFLEGTLRRKQTKRTDLARWDPKLRKHDPLELLRHSMQGRVPRLIPLKYERMALTPFGFFRGAVPVMAADMALLPHTGLYAQLCGDAHVQNLGAYTGPDGRLVFDINDFDETIRGPFEWDLKRMATSILLAGMQSNTKLSGCGDAAETFLTAYCNLLIRLAHMPVLESARYQVHRVARAVSMSDVLQRAERETPLHSQERLTEPGPHHRIFHSIPPILHRITGAQAKAVIESLVPYSKSLLPERQRFLARFRPLDVAFKVVGTGSVGLRDYCIYLEGNGPEDPLFLQVKEEPASAYVAYLPQTAGRRGNQGQRVAEGQRAMQLQSDPLLGWTRLEGRDYLVRQLNDHKASVDVTKLDLAGLCQYAHLCGELLARGHARSGDARPLVGYIGTGGRFTESILAFAHAYADQTVADWKTLKAHLKPNVAAKAAPGKRARA
jgi:uncharacterized protein (DUF2252 family)